MGEVIEAQLITRLDIPTERVLDNCPRDLQDIVIIGFDADGDFFFASGPADGGKILWLMELAKKRLLEVDI